MNDMAANATNESNFHFFFLLKKAHQYTIDINYYNFNNTIVVEHYSFLGILTNYAQYSRLASISLVIIFQRRNTHLAYTLYNPPNII
jgi:hypothetical protein